MIALGHGKVRQASVASPAMGHWGTCPGGARAPVPHSCPRLPTISFLVYSGVNLTANI